MFEIFPFLHCPFRVLLFTDNDNVNIIKLFLYTFIFDGPLIINQKIEFLENISQILKLFLNLYHSLSSIVNKFSIFMNIF
jgi:hypothetical protein